MYLLGHAGWQELNGISRNVTGREDGIFLSVMVERGDQALISSIMRVCLGLFSQLPCTLVVTLEGR